MTENPYDEMDALDEQVINAMYEGAPVDSLVYDVIDYYTKGEMLCDKDGCSIERPHRHLRSVNIDCIYEIINRMKCVMAEITEEIQTLVGDAWYWKVKVVAFDALNVRKGLGAVLEKIGQHPPTSYKMAIAKAKRNAYRELISQTPQKTNKGKSIDLYSKARKLRAEGDRLWREARRLRAEARKLWAEARRLR